MRYASRRESGWLRTIRASGYRAHLVFLALPNADVAVARVAERVRQGGHSVPEDIVRRRFITGLSNLFARYLGAVDTWQMYDNSRVEGPRLIASRVAGDPPVIADVSAWEALKEQRS